MSLIKIFPADKAFGDCIKWRAHHKCEVCGGTPHPQGLHASHYIGRGNWSTRFDPDNVFAHCYGCHSRLGSDGAAFTWWVLERIGGERHEELLRSRQDTKLGRLARKNQKAIAKHYRDQLKLMEKTGLRVFWVYGQPLEFEGEPRVDLV